MSGSCAPPPRWPPQCSCVVIESSFDPGERLQAPVSLWFNYNIKLTEEQKYLCEGNITFKECAQSLKLMTNGKRPGSDGWTVDFYKIKLRRYWYIAL